MLEPWGRLSPASSRHSLWGQSPALTPSLARGHRHPQEPLGQGDGAPAMQAPPLHLPAVPGDCCEAPRRLTVIPCRAKSHFPADGAALLYAAHGTVTAHRPAAHAGQEYKEQGFFREQGIWVLLSLERELGNPTARTSQPVWSQHFPCGARGRSLQRLRVTHGAEHHPPWGHSPPRGTGVVLQRDKTGALKPVTQLQRQLPGSQAPPEGPQQRKSHKTQRW